MAEPGLAPGRRAADASEQAALLDTFGTVRERRAGLDMLLGWNRQGVSELAGAAGEDDWEDVVDGLDTMIRDLCTGMSAAEGTDGPEARTERTPQDAVLSAATSLRHLVLYRFAPLTAPADRRRAVAAAEQQVARARRANEFTSTGFLVHRLAGTDQESAVRLQLMTGLSDGPLQSLMWAVDAAVMHRRDEDTHADLEAWLATSPYRDAVTSRLRAAAVRYRRTPLKDLVWDAVLT